jgi:hypothetical protein
MYYNINRCLKSRHFKLKTGMARGHRMHLRAACGDNGRDLVARHKLSPYWDPTDDGTQPVLPPLSPLRNLWIAAGRR